MYSIADYARMIADARRMEAYTAALRRSVAAGSIVADIGTGTGAFAVLACRMGARKVYAIEPDDAIHVARTMAAANGVADRVELIQAASTDVVLPQPADVIVSDLRGVIPFNGHHIPSIADARTRLLAPGGVLIPRSDRLWAALVESPRLHGEHVAPWGDRTFGLELRPMREMLSNTWSKARVKPEQLLSEARCVASLEYETLEESGLDVEETFTAGRAGTAHGICVWFDTELVEGIGFSNAPGAPEAIYGQAYFPFGNSVALGEGEAVAVRLQARLIGADYIWRWTVRPSPPGGRAGGAEYSTLRGVPIGAGRLHKSAADHLPRLTEQGEIAAFVLSEMRAGRSVGEIAGELVRRHPASFRDWNAALGLAGELSQRYSD